MVHAMRYRQAGKFYIECVDDGHQYNWVFVGRKDEGPYAMRWTEHKFVEFAERTFRQPMYDDSDMLEKCILTLEAMERTDPS